MADRLLRVTLAYPGSPGPAADPGFPPTWYEVVLNRRTARATLWLCGGCVGQGCMPIYLSAHKSLREARAAMAAHRDRTAS